MEKLTIGQILFYAIIFALSVILIENQGETYLAEFAGDVLGAIALISIGIWYAITIED
jgi:hypothetical protein